MGLQSVRVTILVSAAACCLAACGPAPAPHPITADPHSLVISLADLPGWKVDAPNFGLISDPRKMLGDSSDVTPYTNNRWVRAYEADFRSESTKGAQSISVLVSVFRPWWRAVILHAGDWRPGSRRAADFARTGPWRAVKNLPSERGGASRWRRNALVLVLLAGSQRSGACARQGPP